MKRRGMGHLEVVLSFLIFIIAVSFALYFFSPTHTSRLVDSSLTYTFNEIKNNISSEVRMYTVKIKNPSNQITNFVAINLTKLGVNEKVRVTDNNGKVLPSKVASINEGIVYFNNSASNWPTSSIVKILVNDNYIPYSPVPEISGLIVNSSFYDLSSVSKKGISLEGIVLALNRSYWQNYTSLKESFNSNRAEFGFSVIFSNGERIDSKKEVPSGLDVFSNSEKIEILRNSGEIDSAELVVQIW